MMHITKDYMVISVMIPVRPNVTRVCSAFHYNVFSVYVCALHDFIVVKLLSHLHKLVYPSIYCVYIE